MTRAARGSWWRVAFAILIAGAAPLFLFEAVAAAAPQPAASAAPALPPVALHAWARQLGAETSWLEKGKKLRFSHGTHNVVFELGRREVTIDGVRVFLGEAPKPGKRTLNISPVDRDRLLLPLLAPERIAPLGPVRTIMLDAGHGGKDKGTTNAALKLFEKDLALDVVQRLKPLLEARGYEVLLTRSDDTFIELGERPQRAAKAGADLFLAIHFNAGPPAVTGIETYILTPRGQRSTASDDLKPEDNVAAPGNSWDAWNAVLGFTMHRQLDHDLARFDRGLKRARFVVIRDLATCPGVLIECGYLSNAAEAKLISTAAHRDHIAASIAAGVDAFVAQIPSPLPPAMAPAPRSGGGSGGGGGAGAIRAPRPNTAKPTAPR